MTGRQNAKANQKARRPRTGQERPITLHTNSKKVITGLAVFKLNTLVGLKRKAHYDNAHL